MGSGKTNNLIALINESDPSQLFFCVVPLLSEVERISDNCPGKNFLVPNDETYSSKSEALLVAISQRKNIVTTHALFCQPIFSNSILNKISEARYKLVIDETIDMVCPETLSTDDYKMLLETKKITVNEGGRVQWLDSDYSGKHNDFMHATRYHSVIKYKKCLLRLFPIELIKAFPEIEILTFLFEASQMSKYFNIYKLEYKFFHIENGCRKPGLANLSEKLHVICQLLHIYEGNLNRDRQENSSYYSKGWYEQKATVPQIEQVRRDAYNYLHNRMHAVFSTTLWTVFSTTRESRRRNRRVTIHGYDTSFCACNARATNDFVRARYLAYLINVYCNPIIKGWFADHDAPLSDDQIALSQLLQWIWRSAIRVGEEIFIYLPSCRMRRILSNWLNAPMIESAQSA